MALSETAKLAIKTTVESILVTAGTAAMVAGATAAIKKLSTTNY